MLIVGTLISKIAVHHRYWHSISQLVNFFRGRNDDSYRNTIAGLSSGEQIFIYFEKIRFTSQKIEFLNFCFLAKKSI